MLGIYWQFRGVRGAILGLPPGGEPTSRAARSGCIDEPRSGSDEELSPIRADDQSGIDHGAALGGVFD